jgi:hypothetical protein
MNDLSHTVFVYRHKLTGAIETEYLDKALRFEDDENFEHIATINPRMWIEAHYETIEGVKND